MTLVVGTISNKLVESLFRVLLIIHDESSYAQ